MSIGNAFDSYGNWSAADKRVNEGAGKPSSWTENFIAAKKWQEDVAYWKTQGFTEPEAVVLATHSPR